MQEQEDWAITDDEIILLVQGSFYEGNSPQVMQINAFLKTSSVSQQHHFGCVQGNIRLLSQITSDRTRGNGLELCQGRFRLNIRERGCPRLTVCGL